MCSRKDLPLKLNCSWASLMNTGPVVSSGSFRIMFLGPSACCRARRSARRFSMWPFPSLLPPFIKLCGSHSMSSIFGGSLLSTGASVGCARATSTPPLIPATTPGLGQACALASGVCAVLLRQLVDILNKMTIPNHSMLSSSAAFSATQRLLCRERRGELARTGSAFSSPADHSSAHRGRRNAHHHSSLFIDC